MVELLSTLRVTSRAAGPVLALAVLASACAAPIAPEPKTALRPRDGAYLQSPLDGYPRSLSASEAETLRAAYRSLLAGEPAEAAAEVARMLLAANPGLEPAELLWAQSDFAGTRYSAALERAGPVAARYPDYVAAQLVAGRAAEKLDRIKDAFEAYLRAAGRSNLANDRAEELYPRAIEIAARGTEDLLAKGRLEEAGVELDLLESWAPGEVRTLELVAEYSAMAGVPGRELAAIRRLLELTSTNDLLRRRARLEMEAGDAGEGLRILEELTRQNPEDYELALELDLAKFRWRLGLLPAEVRSLLEMPVLTRADHAKLLFWLFPDVRYGRPSQGRIASDILDHPHRQEIARVINLELMRVDRTLHLFHPERALTRLEGLESVLRILSRRSSRPACLGSDEPAARMSVERLCGLAARCGFFPEPGDCLPEATASGRFVETIGFAALDVLGIE